MSTDTPRNPLRIAVTVLILFFLFAPVLVTIPMSFSSRNYLSFPTDGLSLRHYQTLLVNMTWAGSAARSAIVALVSAFFATIVGGLAAFACWQMTGRLPGVIRVLILLPLIFPHIVSALAFKRLLAFMGLFDTFAGVILVNVIISMPYVMVSVTASLALFDGRLLQAARSLGASRSQTIWRVLVPSIRPGLIAGAVFAFICAWDELVILLFITSRNVILLPRALLVGIQDNVDPSIAAVASILIAVTTIGVLLASRYRKRMLAG